MVEAEFGGGVDEPQALVESSPDAVSRLPGATGGSPGAAGESSPGAMGKSSPARPALMAIAVAAVALILWGGYGRRWPWTGINGHTATLWDWLHLLLLPLAVAMLPILLDEHTRMRRGHRLVGIAALITFAVLVLAGYLIPWHWTGFSGNRLWDWLELLALPLAIELMPLIEDIRRRWGRAHTLAATAGAAAFAVAVIGGYAGHWAWTGFRGNTLWDWLHLLLLPLLLPTVIVPRLKPEMKATMEIVEDRDGDRQPPAAVPDAEPPAAPPAVPADHSAAGSPAAQ